MTVRRRIPRRVVSRKPTGSQVAYRYQLAKISKKGGNQNAKSKDQKVNDDKGQGEASKTFHQGEIR